MEFYDLNTDPKEKTNLSSNPAKEIVSIKTEMMAELGRMIKENERLAIKLNVENRKSLSPEETKKLKDLEEELRSLGYVK